MIRRINPFLAGAALALLISSCLITLVVGSAFLLRKQEPNLIPPGDSLAPSLEFAGDIPLDTIPSPLARYEFPSQVIAYPEDWPSQLRYPDGLQLVEASSGSFPGGTAVGYVAKLLYEGDPSNATDLLTEFLTANGWSILDQTELGSGVFFTMIEGMSEGSSGFLIIEPDTSRQGFVKILALAFP